MFKYTSMQVCNYASMQVCKYASIHIYANKCGAIYMSTVAAFFMGHLVLTGQYIYDLICACMAVLGVNYLTGPFLDTCKIRMLQLVTNKIAAKEM